MNKYELRKELVELQARYNAQGDIIAELAQSNDTLSKRVHELWVENSTLKAENARLRTVDYTEPQP